MRGTLPAAPRIEVSIPNVRTAVRGNIARLEGDVSYRPRLVIKAAHETCIQDLEGGNLVYFQIFQHQDSAPAIEPKGGSQCLGWRRSLVWL